MSRIQELKDRCAGLNRKLLSFQSATVSLAAGYIDIALLATMMILIRWPDRRLALEFITGFQIVGEMIESGVLRPGGTEALKTVEEMMALAGDKGRLST